MWQRKIVNYKYLFVCMTGHINVAYKTSFVSKFWLKDQKLFVVCIIHTTNVFVIEQVLNTYRTRAHAQLSVTLLPQAVNQTLRHILE